MRKILKFLNQYHLYVLALFLFFIILFQLEVKLPLSRYIAIVFSCIVFFLLIILIKYEREKSILKYQLSYKNTDNEIKINAIGKAALFIVHDLKNPMSTIQTLVEMANTDQISKEERIRNLTMVYREIQRLNDMAHEILDFVKEKLILKLEKVKLDSFLSEVCDFLKIDFQYANVDFQMDLQYTKAITIDREKVRRVIINIAKNALEAMQNSQIKNKFTISTKQLGNAVLISLVDTGSGISKSIQKRIFNDFVTEGKPNGSGIGLYMAKATMDAHGGTIEYHTEAGVGTTFNLIFSLEEKDEKNINR